MTDNLPELATENELPVPSEDERSTAMLPHILQVFGSFFPPLVILLVKRKSRYVRFHALQALIWQLIATVLTVIAFVGFFIGMMMSMTSMPQGANAQPPKALFFFPVIWLLMMGQYAICVVLAIVYSIKCNRGQWSKYPLIGQLALRWSV